MLLNIGVDLGAARARSRIFEKRHAFISFTTFPPKFGFFFQYFLQLYASATQACANVHVHSIDTTLGPETPVQMSAVNELSSDLPRKKGMTTLIEKSRVMCHKGMLDLLIWPVVGAFSLAISLPT